MVQNLETPTQNETENKLQKLTDKISHPSQPQNVEKRRCTVSKMSKAPFGAAKQKSTCDEMLSPTSSTSVLDNNSDEDLFLDERELKFKN